MKEAAWNMVRPELRRFAHQMEMVLKDNDHKGGWQNMSHSALWCRLHEEVTELRDTIILGKTGADVRKEAIDVANFAMMIFSNTMTPSKGKTLCEVFAAEQPVKDKPTTGETRLERLEKIVDMLMKGDRAEAYDAALDYRDDYKA